MELPSSKTLQDSTIQVQAVVIRKQRLQQHPPLYQLQRHRGDHGMLWSGKWLTIWRWVEGAAKRRTSGRNNIGEGVFLRVSIFSVFVVFPWIRNIFCWRCSRLAVPITTICLPWILQLERWSRGAIDPVLHQIDQLLVKTPQPQPPKGLVWSDFKGPWYYLKHS